MWLRKLFTFYFSSKGTISQRDYILKVVVPGVVILGLIFLLVALKLPVAIITWPLILFSLISLALGNPLEKKRDRDVGNPEGTQDRVWARHLAALVIIVAGFLMTAATLWGIAVMAAGLGYALGVHALRAFSLLSPGKRRG